jgi:hypothetical protein
MRATVIVVGLLRGIHDARRVPMLVPVARVMSKDVG